MHVDFGVSESEQEEVLAEAIQLAEDKGFGLSPKQVKEMFDCCVDGLVFVKSYETWAVDIARVFPNVLIDIGDKQRTFYYLLLKSWGMPTAPATSELPSDLHYNRKHGFRLVDETNLAERTIKNFVMNEFHRHALANSVSGERVRVACP